jgi:Spy/CpxP family protein refolding chaperone
LTPEQAARLETLRQEFTRESIRRDADLRIAEMDLAALLDQAPLDLAKVEAKVRELERLRADLRIARIRTIEQGRALLTPEQRAKLQSLLGPSPRGPRRTAVQGTRL